MRALIVGAAVTLALPFGVCAEETAPEGCEPLAAISGPTLFAENCTLCHGSGGKGGGPLAKALNLTPPDLTTLAARTNGQFPSGHVADMLRNGGGKKSDGDKAMPVWAAIFAHECGAAYANQAVLELEKYVKTIQGK
jgi:putative copper resistance protein D